MEDNRIIELLFRREEAGMEELQCKYFSHCLRIAMNLLSDGRDAEECVSDAFWQAWNSIPPERPKNLRAWLGKVVRYKAFDVWKEHRAKKRSGITQALDELEDSVPSSQNMEQEVEDALVDSAVDRWLRSLPQQERRIFLRRYWYGVSLQELAEELGVSPNKLAQQMYRLRRSLKKHLEKEVQLHG